MLSIPALAACFGTGPTPGQPAAAEVVLVAPAVETTMGCPQGYYLGDVALGATQGYALVLPWLPPNDGCGGSNNINANLAVVRFPFNGGPVANLGFAGRSMGSTIPRVAANATRALWAFPPDSTGGPSSTTEFGSDGGPSGSIVQTGGGFVVPGGVVLDGDTTYIAGWSGNSRPEPNTPSYPCCGSFGGGGTTPQFKAWRLDAAGSATQLGFAPRLACDTISTCFVGNTSTLYYAAQLDGTPSTKYIGALAKAGTSEMMIGQMAPARVPVGLAADDEHVVWLASHAFLTYPIPDPSCTITIFDVAAGTSRPAISSSAFSCMGAALDATHVYFTIVTVPTEDHSNEPYGMRGLGIGRLSLGPDRTFETLALGMTGDFAGPRRVLLAGDDMFVVDPFAIARIAKRELDGKHDF